MRRIVQMIDLADDASAITAYEAAHRPGATPPAVLAAQRRRGIAAMEIYRLGSRLVMVMEVDARFDPAGLDADARDDADIAAWHSRMGLLQRPLRGTDGWAEMMLVFRQEDHP